MLSQRHTKNTKQKGLEEIEAFFKKTTLTKGKRYENEMNEFVLVVTE
jgi:hypothetical protein